MDELLDDPDAASLNWSSSCDRSPKDLLEELLSSRPGIEMMAAWRERYAHPQNHLRNLAKKGCGGGGGSKNSSSSSSSSSKYVFLPGEF